MHLNFQGDRKSDGKFFISRTTPHISSGACAPLCGPLTSLKITNQLRLESPSTWKFALAYYNIYIRCLHNGKKASLITDANFKARKRPILPTEVNTDCNRNSNMPEEYMENHSSNFWALKEKAFDVNCAFPLTFMRNVKMNSVKLVKWHGNFAH